jgi:hypothetical protein
VWGAFDYGFAHPTAFGLLTEDNDGCIYLIGEHVQQGWLPLRIAGRFAGLPSGVALAGIVLERSLRGMMFSATRR